jgi:hypothetical protein
LPPALLPPFPPQRLRSRAGASRSLASLPPLAIRTPACSLALDQARRCTRRRVRPFALERLTASVAGEYSRTGAGLPVRPRPAVEIEGGWPTAAAAVPARSGADSAIRTRGMCGSFLRALCSAPGARSRAR